MNNLVYTSIEIDRGKANSCHQQVELGGLQIFNFTFFDTEKK